MKKYTYNSGLGALDQKTMIIGGMVVALGAIGFFAYRAKKKADEEAVVSTTTSSNGTGIKTYGGPATITQNTGITTSGKEQWAGLGNIPRIQYSIY